MFENEIEYGIILKCETDTSYGLAIKVLWSDSNVDWIYVEQELVEVIR